MALCRGHQGCFVKRWYFSWALTDGQSFTDGSAQVEGIPREEKSGDQGQPMAWAGDLLTIFVPDVEIGGHSGCRGRQRL